MIRLGLRLTLAGGKEALVRLVLTTIAVALGVGLLLVAVAGMHAINAQNSRTAWLNTGTFADRPATGSPTPPGAPGSHGPAPTATTATASTADPLWWLFDADHFGDRTIDRVDVAATGPAAPVPPGIPRLPGPGQFYASPALTTLLRATPANELGNRYPGRQIGTIGPAALPAPNSLIIVIGHTPAELASEPGPTQVSAINTQTGHSGGEVGFNTRNLQVILAVGALALLFPVLVFIATATRLSAARREQRFAALRLVGATPRQVAVLAAVEAAVTAIAGVAVGFAVFLLFRPALAGVPFTGEPFAPSDLSLGPASILLVAVGVPVAATAAAQLTMRRVQISPLGVSRRVTPPPPRAYRVLPLLAGVGELAYFAVSGAPTDTGGQILAFFSGCLLAMVGLVLAGPWLTLLGARTLARRANRSTTLLASRRVADNPHAAFRAVAGLVIAIFVTSLSVGVITTILASHSTGSGTAGSRTLLDRFFFATATRPGQQPLTPPVPEALLASLRASDGVTGVTVLPGQATLRSRPGGAIGVEPPAVFASCAQLLHTPALGRCAAGADVVTLSDNIDNNTLTKKSGLQGTVWPAANMTSQQLEALPTWGLAVQTTGSRSAIERTRTTLDTAFPGSGSAITLGEITEKAARTVLELQQLTDVVIVVSLVIAGCSLAVTVIAGINDRKRPFSLLRLAGAPLQVLRKVVALETAAPLLSIAVLSAGLGFLAAGLFLKSQFDETLRPPNPTYYLLLAAGLAASLAIIAATMPLIARITGPETARSE